MRKNEFNINQIICKSQIIYDFKRKIKKYSKLITSENKLNYEIMNIHYNLIFNKNLLKNINILDLVDVEYLDENFSKINFFLIKYDRKENGLYIKNIIIIC